MCCFDKMAEVEGVEREGLADRLRHGCSVGPRAALIRTAVATGDWIAEVLGSPRALGGYPLCSRPGASLLAKRRKGPRLAREASSLGWRAMGCSPRTQHPRAPMGACSSCVCMHRHFARQAATSKPVLRRSQNSPTSSGHVGTNRNPWHRQSATVQGTVARFSGTQNWPSKGGSQKEGREVIQQNKRGVSGPQSLLWGKRTPWARRPVTQAGRQRTLEFAHSFYFILTQPVLLGNREAQF